MNLRNLLKKANVVSEQLNASIDALRHDVFAFTTKDLSEVDKLKLELEQVRAERDLYFENWMKHVRMVIANTKAREEGGDVA